MFHSWPRKNKALGSEESPRATISREDEKVSGWDWKGLKRPQEQLQASPAFPKFILCYFTSTRGLHRHLFFIKKKRKEVWRGFLVSFKKAKSWNGVQCVFLQWEASHSPRRETGPSELLPRKPPPTPQHHVPQPWALWEHRASRVCAHLGPRLAARAVRSGLWEAAREGSALTALQGDLPLPASTPALGQVTTPASATLRITPPVTPVWTFPDFTSCFYTV